MHPRSPLAAALTLAAVISGCTSEGDRPAPAPARSEAPAPAAPAAPPAKARTTPFAKGPTEADLYADLGADVRFGASTKVPLAARLFDQGLTLAYAFHHGEAARLFGLAAEADPTLAIAWWGQALVRGPHINDPTVSPERSALAWDALTRARALTATASERERALIDALGARYAATPPADRAPLDAAYADAMRAVRRRFPADPHVGALTAEALMDLHPWDLYTPQGLPKEYTPEITSLLEETLAQDPRQIGAAHLYIHAMEASREAAKAAAAANLLRTAVPGAGHLVHMPAHIDVRTGAWAAASEANRRAIEADAKHRARVPKTGFYRIYMMHNRHFLAFSSMMEGRSAEALAAARAMVAEVPPEFIDAAGPFADGLMPVALHVLLRFGRWEEVLQEAPLDPRLTVSEAVRRYARGAALGALGRLDEAEAEMRALDAAIAKVDDRPIGNNPAVKVLEIPRKVLAGEVAFRRGRKDEGIKLLREAAALEDTLLYDEPPDWMTPVRHALGATLIAAKRWGEAEAVFQEDLARFPENGWSLTGLALALRGRGAAGDAAKAEARAKAAFARADTAIDSACLCQPGEAAGPR